MDRRYRVDADRQADRDYTVAALGLWIVVSIKAKSLKVHVQIIGANALSMRSDMKSCTNLWGAAMAPR